MDINLIPNSGLVGSRVPTFFKKLDLRNLVPIMNASISSSQKRDILGSVNALKLNVSANHILVTEDKLNQVILVDPNTNLTPPALRPTSILCLDDSSLIAIVKLGAQTTAFLYRRVITDGNVFSVLFQKIVGWDKIYVRASGSFEIRDAAYGELM